MRRGSTTQPAPRLGVVVRLVGYQQATWATVWSRLWDIGSSGNLVHRQARCCFEAADEVEDGDECGGLVNRAIVPAGVSQRCDVLIGDSIWSFGQALGIVKQRSRLRVNGIVGPLLDELWAEVVIAREPPHRFAVGREARLGADDSVNNRGDHLALQARKRRVGRVSEVVVGLRGGVGMLWGDWGNTAGWVV